MSTTKVGFHFFLFLAGAAVGLAASACGSNGETPSDGGPAVLSSDAPTTPVDAAVPPPDGAASGSMIGKAGGTITSPSGISIVIPPQALDEDLAITINESIAPTPTGGESTVFSIGPADTILAVPATVVIPAPGAATQPTVMWSTLDGSGYEDIGGGPTAGTVQAKVVHFGQGYVAETTGKRTIWGVVAIHVNDADTFYNDFYDFSENPAPTALVASGSGYTTYPGTGYASGLFSITGVPTGHALVELFPALFVDTTDSVVDGGYEALGRANQTPISATSTNLSFTATNLDPWVAGDDLEFFSASVDDWFFGIAEAASSGVPTTGATALTNLMVNEAASANVADGGYLSVIDSTMGDTSDLVQLSTGTAAAGVSYKHLTRELVPTSLSMLDAQTTAVTGAFAPASQSTISVDLRGSAFTQMAVGQPTSHMATTFSVAGQPWPNGSIGYSSTPDYLTLEFDNQDVTATGLSYGVPTIANGWQTFGQVALTWQVTYMAPSAVIEQAQAAMVDDLTTFSAGPVVPRVTPVQNVTIAGHAATAQMSGVGMTPVIAWQPPTTGSNLVYNVQIRTPVAGSNGLVGSRAAFFTTTATSITVPEGILTGGATYWVVIDAAMGASVDLPNGASTSWAYTPYYTASFTP